MSYVYLQGYEKLLLCLGDGLVEFLTSLNNLHLSLSSLSPAMSAPAFRCSDETPTSVKLHYTSTRPALWPIVKGIVLQCGESLFKHPVTCELIAGRDPAEGIEPCDHEIFLVTFPEQPRRLGALSAAAAGARDATLSLAPALFHSIFPCHILVDKELNMLQLGSLAARVLPGLRRGGSLCDVLSLRHPHCGMTAAAMLAETDSIFLFVCKGGGVELKGAVYAVPHAGMDAVLLLLSPRISSLEELQTHQLFLSDYPAHDMGRDHLLLAEHGKADLELKHKYEASLLELQRTHEALAAEEQRSKELLYAMLPRAVARRLLAGEEEDAGQEYGELSILISDIVGFSPLAARLAPRQVLAFLSELYSRFDMLIESPRFADSGIYKVETVGDAYMAVCNLEKPVDDHADVLLAFAREMHAAAAEVLALDADGGMSPTRIRIGLHTGAAVGGVIGRAKPQFCLFGNSINTAARMESHGVPGAIHLSDAAYSRLRRPEESGAVCRGVVEIKGLGAMTTHLVLCTAVQPGDDLRRADSTPLAN